MTEELIAKAKEAQSPEELLTLLQENGMEDFTEEEAGELYAQLHTTGELTDEELENVTGGKVTVGGQTYKVVSSGTFCFTNHWSKVFDEKTKGVVVHYTYKRTDHLSLRKTWAFFAIDQECGNCYHLGFTKSLAGYCEVEHGS